MKRFMRIHKRAIAGIVAGLLALILLISAAAPMFMAP
jgi:hypothetical protein